MKPFYDFGLKKLANSIKIKKEEVWILKDDGTKELVDTDRLYRFSGDLGWRLSGTP